jgi:hypothetical protein
VPRLSPSTQQIFLQQGSDGRVRCSTGIKITMASVANDAVYSALCLCAGPVRIDLFCIHYVMEVWHSCKTF